MRSFEPLEQEDQDCRDGFTGNFAMPGEIDLFACWWWQIFDYLSALRVVVLRIWTHPLLVLLPVPAVCAPAVLRRPGPEALGHPVL